MKRSFLLGSLFLSIFLLAGSCEDTLCGCDPVPVEQITNESLTNVPTWWLNETGSGGQITSAGAIKDRYSIQFKTDGTYTQTLLADGTFYRGTWMLMGADRRTLHLTDHKGTAQEYTILAANNASLVYSRPDKNQQQETFSFGSTRK